MTKIADDAPKAVCRVDETGLVTVSAPPQWWRKQGQASDWPEYAEMFAQAGKKARSDDVCGVMGRTTHRPCRHNIRLHGPCPHHCETPLRCHCAAPRKKGGWCRWDLRKGRCEHHPDSCDEFMAASRADEEEALLRQAVREQDARNAAEERHRRIREVACPYCAAPSGQDCVRTNGEPRPNLHGVRESLWQHTEVANASPCSYCAAAVGELCRTSSGNLAGQAHAGR